MDDVLSTPVRTQLPPIEMDRANLDDLMSRSSPQLASPKPEIPSPVVPVKAPVEEFIPNPKPKLQNVKSFYRKDRVDVHVKIRFMKIGDINTAQEMFKASVFLQAKWLEPTLDQVERKGRCFELLNWEDYWTPDLNIDNLVDEGKSQRWHLVTYDKDGRASIIQRATVRGSFHEIMELRQFPFDSQELTITVTTKHGADKICLHADDTDQKLTEKDFSDCSEWFLHEHFSYKIHNPPTQGVEPLQQNKKKKKKKNTDSSALNRLDSTNHLPKDVDPPAEYIENSTEIPGGDEINLPRAYISKAAKATRKPQFYVFNITLFIMILGALIFTTFAIECTLVGNRLQTTSTIMLSNIAFKLAVSNSMPRVSYFTYLDFYILLSLVQMGLVLGWHGIVFQMTEDDQATTRAVKADKVALVVLVAFYLAFNVIFLAVNLFRVYRLKTVFSRAVNEVMPPSKDMEAQPS